MKCHPFTPKIVLLALQSQQAIFCDTINPSFFIINLQVHAFLQSKRKF